MRSLVTESQKALWRRHLRHCALALDASIVDRRPPRGASKLLERPTGCRAAAQEAPGLTGGGGQRLCDRWSRGSLLSPESQSKPGAAAFLILCIGSGFTIFVPGFDCDSPAECLLASMLEAGLSDPFDTSEPASQHVAILRLKPHVSWP